MNPQISFVTLGVKNLQEMRQFYSDTLGWLAEKADDEIAFFKMNHGLTFALYPAPALAEDIGIAAAAQQFKNMSLAINMPSKKEVDDYFRFLISRKVTIQKMPAKVVWGGYRGYFADPENNYWEVVYNPFLEKETASF